MIELKCKNCGATINRDRFSNNFTCPYCKSKFFIENNFDNNNEYNRLLENSIKNGYNLLNNGEYENAYNTFKNALNYDFENAEIYFGLLLAKVNVPNKEKFIDIDKNVSGTIEYKNACKYSNEQTQEILTNCFRKDEKKREKHPSRCRCIDCKYYIINGKCEIYDIKPISFEGYCQEFKWKK